MPEQVYELTLVEGDKGYKFLVFGSKRTNSFVEYSDEKDVKRLRSLIENPENYNGKINVLWNVKDGEVLRQSQLELMSAEEVRNLVGVDFIAGPRNLIKFHDSKRGLLKAIEDNLYLRKP